MAICAEAVALGQAITDAGETGIDTIVAVRHPPPEEKDRADRGGVAVRRLPGADLGLRSQCARHRAGAQWPGVGRNRRAHAEQVQPRTRDLSREHHAPPPRRRPSAARRTSPRPRCGRSGCPSSSASSRRAPISRCSSRPRGRATRRSTTCCSSARRASARPRWRRSSRASSASTSAPPRGRSSPRPAISRRCSPISRSATCCSSTKSTGSIRRSRRSSIRRWRISSSTSSSAKGRRRAR